MNKITFIQELEKGLKKIGVRDSIDIIKDYEVHFENELSKGKSEEEIAKELGNIEEILIDFQQEDQNIVVHRKVSSVVIIISNVFGYLGIFFLYILNLSLLSSALASMIIGLYLMFSFEIFSFMPLLLSPFSIFAGLTIIILSIFFFGLSILFYKLNHRLVKRLINWNRTLKTGQDQHVVDIKPSILIIRITQISGISLLIFVVISYIVGVLMTRQAEFWHYWNWFS
jgi:uncharacterized membrane protein